MSNLHPFDGQLAVLIPVERVPLAEVVAPVGRVWILCRDSLPGTEIRPEYFHSILRKHQSDNFTPIWNSLRSHAMPFERADLLAVYAKFLSRLVPEYSLTCMLRHAHDHELRTPAPRWWTNPKFTPKAEGNLDAFEASIRAMMAPKEEHRRAR